VKFPMSNNGSGMSWVQGPPRSSGTGDLRSGLGGYTPLPRGGAPEPLGCDGGGYLRVRGGGCGCQDDDDGIYREVVINVVSAGILLGAGYLIGKLLKSST
jgi:hypothetical protein